MFLSNVNSQYSFLKNLFLSFLIVNFYFVVFFKADRGILKQHPLLTPLNPLRSALKNYRYLCKLFYIYFKMPLSVFIINMRISPNPRFNRFLVLIPINRDAQSPFDSKRAERFL
ncbi:hypothetical protein N403_05765 [Helicobacter pylori FD430]|nr:hypothetical protein N403_05765 [Helicobacter pylori FD430]